MNILLGVTGSVAATLTPKLVAHLVSLENEVRIVATEKALCFWPGVGVPKTVSIYTDKREWQDVHDSFTLKKTPVAHISLRDGADLLLVAPLTANTLAKLANGLADNLLTSVARAWDKRKPIVLAPAMNTHMWEHPATAEHLARIQRWFPWVTVVSPVKKMLACGTEGVGALADIETIVDAVMLWKEAARVHACRRA